MRWNGKCEFLKKLTSVGEKKGPIRCLHEKKEQDQITVRKESPSPTHVGKNPFLGAVFEHVEGEEGGRRGGLTIIQKKRKCRERARQGRGC